jgi:hypothetical protein
LSSRLDRFAPTRRDEPRREVSEWRENEQALPGEPMRDDEVGRA